MSRHIRNDHVQKKTIGSSPLAYRLRPKTLNEYVGQAHLLGPGKFLSEALKRKTVPSLILWGPPGVGKTSLAQVIARDIGGDLIALSAVTSGIKDIKASIDTARDRLERDGVKTLLFIDEIHRFNKTQQDALLPHVEAGTVTLIGATTENPSFEVNGALRSRARILVLEPLNADDLSRLIDRALLSDAPTCSIDDDARALLIASAEGDARRLLNTLEAVLARLDVSSTAQPFLIDRDLVQAALESPILMHDKAGESHYNVISAFIKSMRGSDPDAAVYYLARLLEAGEAPLFVARRMVIFASEDVGNADPQAIQVAVAAMQAFDFVGMPEGWIPLAHAATYLANAPKSNAAYLSYKRAKADVEAHGSLPVPLHLRNAPTTFMRELGYGAGYEYAHDAPDQLVTTPHLPERLIGKRYYHPTENGYEARIKTALENRRNKRGF